MDENYGLTGSVNDPNSYPDVPGVDWGDAANRLAFIQNSATNQVKSMVNDSGDISQYNLQSILDSKLDSSTKDYLVQYYLNERSSQNAFNRELQASSTQYQRAVEDLRKAGLNPFLALQSLGGSGASSSSGSITGGLNTSKANNQRDFAGNLMKVFALIAAAAARVMR